MSNYKFHAMQEFRAAGWINEEGKFNDEMQEAICENILELLDVFHSHHNSGTSAPYTVDLFSKLALFKPLVPLTGEDWEWNDVSTYCADERMVSVYQNKRYSAVFKQSDRFDGQPYHLEGRVFWEWNINSEGEPYKSYYTNSESFTPITFPYTPTTEYVYKYSDAEPPAPPQTEEGLL